MNLGAVTGLPVTAFLVKKKKPKTFGLGNYIKLC